MFESLGHGKSLDEERFESWLEEGRSSYLGYLYLLVIWNEGEEDFQPVFVTERERIYGYVRDIASHEQVVAAYDLYSESRIALD
ncbi:MAG: hypothetical protein AAGA85_27375 [Bacteroidota bacterium]